MEPNQKEKAVCSLCRAADQAKEELAVNKWHLTFVTDYKARTFDVLGFPSGGFVTVEGWKFYPNPDFETLICASCVEASRKTFEAQQAKSIAWAKRLMPVFFGLSAIVFISAGIVFVAQLGAKLGGLSGKCQSLLLTQRGVICEIWLCRANCE